MPSEINKIIRYFKNSTAKGPNEFSDAFVKEGCEQPAIPLAYIINKSTMVERRSLCEN